MFSRFRTTYGLLGLFGVALLAWSTLGSPSLRAAAVPLALTGFNADVVTENSATPSAVRFDGGTAAWFEAGLGGHADGLPNSRVFVKDGSSGTTNTGTTFMFQPYTGNNVLRLLPGATSGSLTLVTPGSFTQLAILASSGSGGGTGNALLHFSNGTTTNITYSAVDWNQNSNPPGPAAIGNLGRNENVGTAGTSFTYGKPVPFAMYETDINLLSLGLSGLTLTSVDFTGLAGSAAVTGVFALS